MGGIILGMILGLLISGGIIALTIYTKIKMYHYIANIFAEKISEKFNYNYLAKKTAEEIIRRQMIIEKNKQKREEEEIEIEP